MTELTPPASCPSSGPTPHAAGILASAARALAAERHGLGALTEALAEKTPLGHAFVAVVERVLHCRGRVILTGIGKSGHVARKIQATLASTGTPSLYIHPAEAAHGDLGMIGPDDVLIVLSHSGETSELVALLEYAARHDLAVIGLTAAPESTLARASRITLVLPRAPEACPMGLAPTTSTLMQMALGDALAVALLEQRGFTANDFGIFHPGGRLGQLLRPVHTLMHAGDAMPLGGLATPLSSVILEMTRKAFGCMGVVDEAGRMVGLISDGDLRPALHRDLATTRADAVMNPHPLTIGPDMLAQEALRVMNARPRPVTSLFVLDESGRPLGILHIHDLLRAGVT
ncbi:KpsF/GutQ family sugar-phosphate isomerase [Acidomonas methanolica]|nr:KpsF/GutQ family sugar-phosphate isomerase [Acidomonas methanolica]MBU2653914.1 KpsF/GutQ family sugar-phosphate isomerase [Acidomonas methanolica]